jgi:hypothetical protein
MTFLSVVQRELAVTARRPATYWSRLTAVGLATLIGTIALLAAASSGGLTSGRGLFNTASALLLLYCLLEGARITADSLVDEKRAGTLGLLFLTDLRGLDVVLGKLASSSLRTSAALIGVLPVAALVVPLGGVSGGEFARVALALGVALWVSLAAGLAVSAFSCDSSRALWATLAGLGAWCAGPLLLAAAARQFPNLVALSTCEVLSPLTAFWRAADPNYGLAPNRYWGAAAFGVAGGMGLIACAAWAAPRFWQDQPVRRIRAFKPAGYPREQEAATLSTDPAAWLVLREARGDRLRLGTLIVTVLAGAPTMAMVSEAGPAGLLLLPMLLSLALKIIITMQTARFFARLRQEQLVATLGSVPIPDRDLLKGFARGMLAVWRVPLTVLFASLGIAGLLVVVGEGGLSEAIGSPFFAAYFLATEALDFVALYWASAWLAFNSGRANGAAVRALVWVHLLPAVVCCGLRLVVDLLVWSWGRSRLMGAWRQAAFVEPGQPLKPEAISSPLPWRSVPPPKLPA